MALAAVRGDKTLAELAQQQHDVHPNQITGWTNQLLTRAADVFGGKQATAKPAIDLKALHAKTGQLALENDFLEGALIKRRHAERKAMIDQGHGSANPAPGRTGEHQPQLGVLHGQAGAR